FSWKIGWLVKEVTGATGKVSSSLAPRKPVMANMPSPPGRFSTTIGCPQATDSLSANNRAPISTPLPGPSVMMKWTGRLGQVSAAADGQDSSGDSAKMVNAKIQRAFKGLLMAPPQPADHSKRWPLRRFQ